MNNNIHANTIQNLKSYIFKQFSTKELIKTIPQQWQRLKQQQKKIWYAFQNNQKKTDILTSYTCLLEQRNIKLKAELANFFENFQTAVSRGGSLRQKTRNYRALWRLTFEVLTFKVWRFQWTLSAFVCWRWEVFFKVV